MTPLPRAYEARRGRPSGRSSRHYPSYQSLVLLASKRDLDPKRLIDALYEALERGVSRCGRLRIARRGVHHDVATFLITKDEDVIWQYPLDLEVLQNADARKLIQTIPMPYRDEKNEYETTQKIGDLRYGMKGITVTAKVVKIPPAKVVGTRWGSSVSVSNVTLADETGSVRLALWNGQIKTVHIGDKVEVNDVSVTRFRGELHLRLKRNSSISVIH